MNEIQEETPAPTSQRININNIVHCCCKYNHIEKFALINLNHVNITVNDVKINVKAQKNQEQRHQKRKWI